MAAINRLLKRIALGIAVGGSAGCFGIYMWKKREYKQFLQSHFESSQYYNDAWNLLKGYPHLANFLELPVEKEKINVKDPFNKEADGFAKLAIPLHGKTGEQAFLMSWASQHKTGDSEETYWRIDRLDLKKAKPCTFYVHPDIKNGGHPEATEENT